MNVPKHPLCITGVGSSVKGCALIFPPPEGQTTVNNRIFFRCTELSNIFATIRPRNTATAEWPMKISIQWLLSVAVLSSAMVGVSPLPPGQCAPFDPGTETCNGSILLPMCVQPPQGGPIQYGSKSRGLKPVPPPAPKCGPVCCGVTVPDPTAPVLTIIGL